MLRHAREIQGETDSQSPEPVAEAPPADTIQRTPEPEIKVVDGKLDSWYNRLKSFEMSPTTWIPKPLAGFLRLPKSQPPIPPSVSESDKPEGVSEDVATTVLDDSKPDAVQRPNFNVPDSEIPHWPVPFMRLWYNLWLRVVYFLGQKYDLTPYGFPVTIDFRWGR